MPFDKTKTRAMAAELDSVMAEVGYAKVIVALRPQVAAAAVAAAEKSLSSYFSAPSQPEVASLALSARRSASKGFARPKAVAARAVRVYPRLGLALGFVTPQGAAGLAADVRVGAIVPAPELSLIKPVEMLPAKAAAGTTWGIDRLRVSKLWNAGITGKGVVVGHLDTGVDASHPALQGALAAFAEFDHAGDQVTGANPWDSGEHGTHTAGTIAGRASGGGQIGVAPDAKLASAMVIEGGQVIDRILAGMEWILGHNARILSMSLGLRGFTPAFQVIIDALRNQNVLPVIAVGNEGVLTSRSPGNYANVLSVGACDSNDRIPVFSSSQSFDRAADPLVPDIVAPGVDVLSCIPNGGYARMNGSSMSTPHVAGLAALLLQAMPGANVAALEAAIFGSCSRPAGMPKDRANRGVPDAPRAITALTGRALADAGAFAAAKAPRKKKAVRGKPPRKAGRRSAPKAARASSKRTAKRAKARRGRG